MNQTTKTILTQLRQIVFGLEDGMVSTLGAITGLAGATDNQAIVIVSGFVVIAVESLSMAAGTYLSNKSEQRADSLNHKFFSRFAHPSNPAIDGLYMGISYIIGGIVPLYAYWFFPVPLAIPISISSVVIALFFLGYSSGKLTQASPLKSAFEMVMVSLSAAGLGYLVGKIAGSFFPELHQP